MPVRTPLRVVRALPIPSWRGEEACRPAAPGGKVKDTFLRGVSMSSMIVELIRDPEQAGFTARVPDIPAYGEGETEDEAIADSKEALLGYIETFGLDDALARLSRPTVRSVD